MHIQAFPFGCPRKNPSAKKSAQWITCGTLVFVCGLQTEAVAATITPAVEPGVEQVTAETIAAGAAVGELVVSVVGGLSTWINSQSDGVAAAATGAAFGAHGGGLDEAKDTGWASAFAYAHWPTGDGADEHGRGAGVASATESVFGQWAGSTLTHQPFASTIPLHGKPDNHNAKGFASASVDGTVRATTKDVIQPQVAAASFEPPLDPPSGWPPACDGPDGPGTVCNTLPGWDYTPSEATLGDVWLSVLFPTESFGLSLSESNPGGGAQEQGALDWAYDVFVDGIAAFSARVAASGADGFAVDGLSGVAGLDADDFLKTQNGGTTSYRLLPNVNIDGVDYHVTNILLAKLAPPVAGRFALSLPDTVELDISADGSMRAIASIAAVPVPSALTLLLSALIVLGLVRRKLFSGAVR